MSTNNSYLPTILVTVGIILIVKLYFYFKRSFNYFKNKDIPHIKPTIPFGNTNISFYRKYGQELEKIYVKLKEKDVPYGGFYIMSQPVFLPIDPELIKTILIKDFHTFNTRGIYCNEEREFLSAHLFALSGAPWKSLRQKFSPTFSPNKMKLITDTMIKKMDNLEIKLTELSNTKSSFDMKDLAVRITNDITCTTIFGIDCSSLVDPNNEFQKQGKNFFTNNLVHGMKLIIAITLPRLFEFFNLKFVKKSFSDFFIRAITEVVEYREKNGIERPDFMNLLIKMKNNINIDSGEKNEDVAGGITLKQLISQCFAYFLGGLDTSSTTVMFCIYELTQNQNLQDKLREEINTTFKNGNGSLTLDSIMGMKLLSNVINETLRKYPPFVVLNRKATQDYTIPGTKTVLEKGTPVMISILGVHYDPEYYPEPHKFNPDRFTEEEVAKRPTCSFLPFGHGPRLCIGYRFGLVQAKIAVIHLLKNHRFTLNPATKLPVQLQTEAVLLSSSSVFLNVEKVH